MVSIEERLQIKREPLDKWSIREQLCLASAVARSGDQNWMSVSRALKHFGEPNRPTDWFHQKNCAAQYGALLENVETPKRKKRTTGGDGGIETPTECILRKLTAERQAELKKLLTEEKAEYQKLQEDMTLLQSGNVSEEQLDKWCKEIDEQEKRKEQESIAHAQWLKERELRKQEIERAWRPAIKGSPGTLSLKRKADVLDSLTDTDTSIDEMQHHFQPEIAKPALSPLLTSLLKSPSQVSSANSSILHSAITSLRNVCSTSANPTITSLLNSSTSSLVTSPSVQYVTTNITHDLSHTMVSSSVETQYLEDAVDSLPHLKMEDIESTILSSDDPLPEIKNEEVEVIISDLMENVDDIVNDPEQHIKLDGSDDIITSLENELKELCEKEENEEEAKKEAENVQGIFQLQQEEVKKAPPKIDPFEFEEDPEIFQPSFHMKQSEVVKHDHYSAVRNIEKSSSKEKEREDSELSDDIQLIDERDIKVEEPDEKSSRGKDLIPGSVEIVEVVVMEEDEDEKSFNKSQIQDIVHSHKIDEKIPEETQPETVQAKETPLLEQIKEEPEETDTTEPAETPVEIKREEVGEEEQNRRNTFTPDFSEEYLDDLEVTKLDKTGKAKRDYSRTKKKEEKDFDILLAIEKAVNETRLEDVELAEDAFSDREFEGEKKMGGRLKLKSETERSNSPWTEEEEATGSSRSKRRYSTPATPVDSVPGSPASSTATYPEDERDYRNWKKSVMLVYARLAAHKYSSFFLKPITDDQAPGYHSLVYRPMDLQTIRRNIETGVIRTTIEFQRDVLLMFNNAIMYNKTHGHVYSMAQEMQMESIQHIQLFVEAQAQGDGPARRETRTSEPGCKRKRPSEDLGRDLARVKKRKED